MKIEPEKLWSIEAEAGVLGSMMIKPECIGEILSLLDEKSFFKPEHQTIYNCLTTLFVAGIPVDVISLRTELKQLNQLEKIGGVDYISQLMDSLPSSANARYYAGVVKDRQQYRNLIQTVEKISKIPNEPLKINEQIQQVQELALSLGDGKLKRGYFTFAQDTEKIAAELVEDKTFIKTGLRNIDFIIDGICPGELIILAGRPAMGKSALSSQISLNMAQAGLSIIYFSLEMTCCGLVERALKQHTTAELKKMNVTIHERADTPEKQIGFIRTIKKIHEVDVVCVDYLQLMSSGTKNENRTQEISTISRKLKLAAIQENIPIIALSQLNRAVENRDKHRPRLSDLRESGSIEQDADVVMLIHREDVYRRQEDPNAPQDGSSEVIIAKNRRGTTGIAELVFLDSKVTFRDKAKD